MNLSAAQGMILGPLNHVIRSESWAQDRLKTHAGSHILVTSGPLRMQVRIDQAGLLASDTSDNEPQVSLIVPSDTLVRLLLDRETAFASVRLSGAVDLAESLAFVLRNLRWDYESDLADLLGDIPAHRLARWLKQLGNQMQETLKRTGQNFSEFASEDSLLIAPQREIVGFSAAVDTLRDDLARLEKRVSRLA